MLDRIDRELGGGPRTWADVAIVRNVGPLETAAPLRGDRISNRGFNAVVFAPRGAATHFLKVRPLWHAAFEREAGITVALSEDARCRPLLPASRCFVAGPARVLAQSFLEGQALDVLISAGRGPSWHALAAEVLRTAAPLHAVIADIGVREAAAPAIALDEDLTVLAALGLDPAACVKLAERAAAGALTLASQHGDFWPRNVLRVGDGWRIIDFESCGEPATPLFDVFHFIRGCSEAAGRDAGNWLTRWLDAGRAARALADEVRRAAGGMDVASIEAALVAYTVRFAAALHRRGIARARIEGRLHELAALPRQLDDGVVPRLLAA